MTQETQPPKPYAEKGETPKENYVDDDYALEESDAKSVASAVSGAA